MPEGDLYGRSLGDERPRCWRCQRLLAELVTRPWAIRCGRCKALNQSES
jgi:phage FluMu protein Com